PALASRSGKAFGVDRGGRMGPRRPVLSSGRKRLGASALLDLAGGAVEDRGDGADLLGAERTASEPDRQRRLEIAQCAADLRRRTAAIGAGNLRHPSEDLVEDGPIRGEERGSLRRGSELLSPALGGVRPDVAEFFEQGQRRIDHAGTRAVEAAE